MQLQEDRELFLENVGAIFFFITFILFVMIVLVNVAVAVLLEGFLSSISRYEQEERQVEGMEEYLKSAGDLDALLSTLSSYNSQENLESMIHRTYEYLDVDGSDSINFDEFKIGLERLDLQPKLYVTYETYESFTRNLTLCDEDGCLTSAAFALCMRIQLRGYAQRIIAHRMSESIKYAALFHLILDGMSIGISLVRVLFFSLSCPMFPPLNSSVAGLTQRCLAEPCVCACACVSVCACACACTQVPQR